jgi:murein DD-endopeptidase MepM/ murein hydrolase activator NlpD
MKKTSKKRTGNSGSSQRRQSEQRIVKRDATPLSNESSASADITADIIVSVPLGQGIKQMRCPRLPAAMLLGCVVSLLCAAGWAVCDYSRLVKLSLNEQEAVDELLRRNDLLSKEAAQLKSQIAQLSYRVRAAATRQRWLTHDGAHYMRAAGLSEAAPQVSTEEDEWTAWGDVEAQLPSGAHTPFRGQGGVGGSERNCSVTKGECKRGALKSAKWSRQRPQKSILKASTSKRRGTFTRLTSSRIASRSVKPSVRPASFKITSPTSNSAHLLQPTAGRITSHFGIRRSPFRRGRQLHEGMDIDCTTGAPIRAAGAGMVLAVGRHSSYGLVVDIAHSGNVKTRYAHLSSSLVRAGAPIARGTVLGRCGSSGRSTGAHLHFEVHQNGSPVDPRRYLFRGDSLPGRSSRTIQVASSNQVDNRSKGTRRIG